MDKQESVEEVSVILLKLLRKLKYPLVKNKKSQLQKGWEQTFLKLQRQRFETSLVDVKRLKDFKNCGNKKYFDNSWEVEKRIQA